MTKAGRRRLKIFIYFMLTFMLFIFQTTKGFRITLFGASPDYIVMLIPAVALFEGPYLAGVLGFFSGILLSTSSPNVEGVEALWLSLIGVFVGHFGALYLRRVLPALMLVGLSAILARGLISYVFYYGLAYSAPALEVLRLTVLKALWSIPFGALIYRLVRWLNLRFSEEER